jgi:hypothetical protein
MFDEAFFLSEGPADVFGPAPPGFVRGAANGHAAQMNNFKFSFLKCADFVWRLKPFQNDFGHDALSLRASKSQALNSPPVAGRLKPCFCVPSGTAEAVP